MADDPRAALMAALRHLAERAASMSPAHVWTWIAHIEDQPEAARVLAAVDAIEAAARESAERSPDAW